MKTGGLISAAKLRRRLLSSTRGSMTIPGLIFFTVLMAVGGLAIDMQRLYGVHGTMQAFVDDVALAAAAELDGQGTALSRSFNAACGTVCGGSVGPLVSGPVNSAQFATTTTLTIRRITFLQSIGVDPGPLAPTPTMQDVPLCTFEDTTDDGVANGTWTPGGCNTNATLAQDARFVEIVAQPRTVSYIVLPIANVFGQVFGTGQLEASLRLRATAGFRRAICNNTPLMVCNPAEVLSLPFPQGGTGADFDPVLWNGRQILARVQGSGWEPPNFGLLDNYPGSGANEMQEAMARVSPGTICTEDQVTIKTGVNTGPVRFGMNVRFDWYLGDMGKNSNNAEYRPAPGVVKGMQPGAGANGACNPAVSDMSVPLPRDNCFMASPTPGAGTGCLAYNGENRFGDGQWARQAYWDANHPTTEPPAGYIAAVSPANPTGGWTRYQTYRYEVETFGAQVNLPSDENGAPACYSGGTSPNLQRDQDRRLLYVAVVNCLEHGPSGTNTLGRGPVPVKAYAKVFMTEPVGNTDWDNRSRVVTNPDDGTTYTITWGDVDINDMMIEVVDVVRPNDESGHLHVYPVLYR